MQPSTARRQCSKNIERTTFYIRRRPLTPYGNDKVENGIGLIKTLTRTIFVIKSHWYMTARYTTYNANKIRLTISMCPCKKHTVWEENYKEKTGRISWQTIRLEHLHLYFLRLTNNLQSSNFWSSDRSFFRTKKLDRNLRCQGYHTW
jgi:hypothetical protein